MRTKKLLIVFLFLIIGMLLFIPNSANATDFTYVDSIVLDFTKITNFNDFNENSESAFNFSASILMEKFGINQLIILIII